jgi:PilZ domain
VTDLESEKQVATLARNLSLFGCFVATATPFVAGTKVRLRITHRGATFAAVGRVAYASAAEGMGIAFGEVEARDRAILDTWLGEHEV